MGNIEEEIFFFVILNEFDCLVGYEVGYVCFWINIDVGVGLNVEVLVV